MLGWTPPAGSRHGFGSLHIGYYDPEGRLHDAGVGSGYAARDLTEIKARLERIPSEPPDMLMSGEPLDLAIAWVRPELVIAVQFAAWSGARRMRHAVFASATARPRRMSCGRWPTPGARDSFVPPGPGSSKRIWHSAVPPRPKPPLPAPAGEPKRAAPGARKPARPATIAVAKAPNKMRSVVGTVELTHPDRPLWPGITKQDLATYWRAVTIQTLSGLVHRPLSILRCPVGIAGAQFFQKNGDGTLPHPLREGRWDKQPYLATDGVDGQVAMAQDAPRRFLAHTQIADRRGRIPVDWLRNRLGATAVASYGPHARSGAGVATPLAWSEANTGNAGDEAACRHGRRG